MPHYRLQSGLEPSPAPCRCGAKGLVMPTDKQRAQRRAKQAKEVEATQKALRASIAESKRLIDEATEITQRHRKELEDDERT